MTINGPWSGRHFISRFQTILRDLSTISESGLQGNLQETYRLSGGTSRQKLWSPLPRLHGPGFVAIAEKKYSDCLCMPVTQGATRAKWCHGGLPCRFGKAD